MEENIIYYSTNTKLSLFINRTYYKSKHFVWCSPVFNPKTLNEYDVRKNIPPSSSPHNLYKLLLDDVNSEDNHSSKIHQNRTGLIKGATIMLEKGVIDEDDYGRILKIIKTANFGQFTPLLYVIPKHLVENRIIRVDIESSANSLSTEFQIEDLSSEEFEIIEFK